jgi:glycosyltransferase involved in cell wall biosynthesis
MPATPRIAFISSLALGGSTTFLSNISGELTRRKIPVIVVSPEKENAFASDFEKAWVKVFLHDNRRLIYEDRLHAILGILAEFQPTTVVGCLGQATYEVLRYVPSGVRRVTLIQADAPIFYDAAAPFSECMDDIVGVSKKITERLETMAAFNAVTKHYLPYGVAMPNTFTPRETGDRPLRILYLGRIMDGQKRIYLFPKFLAALKKSGIPFQWTIAGEGDQRANLERLMSSANPTQQVLFPGPLPYSQVPALLEQHDVFLLASDAEGLPMSLLEAMGHGLVPVVSDLESGIRDVVDAGNGILVPVNDIEGYARAIIHLHEHREELAAKSAAARERVRQQFSVKAMTGRWLAAFPQNTPAVGAWPATWNIKPPLGVLNPFYYSPPLRVIRRLAAKLRH